MLPFIQISAKIPYGYTPDPGPKTGDHCYSLPEPEMVKICLTSYSERPQGRQDIGKLKDSKIYQKYSAGPETNPTTISSRQPSSEECREYCGCSCSGPRDGSQGAVVCHFPHIDTRSCAPCTPCP